MSKTEKLVIPFDSPEAARQVTVTGWVSPQGRFYGGDERAVVLEPGKSGLEWRDGMTTSNTCLFAHTELSGTLPAYISINKRNGHYHIALRARGLAA